MKTTKCFDSCRRRGARCGEPWPRLRVTGGPATAPNVGQITWEDYDNHGYSDLIVSSGASAGHCRVFRNNGNGAFKEITGTGLEQATFSTGLAWGDYDNDGL